MTKRIDSDALGVLNRALGLTGSGAQVTELTDGVVDQVLDIVPVVRRGRTQTDVQGLYFPTFRNTHGAANTQTNSIDPYNVGATFDVPPYPENMPAAFDIWLIGASLRVVSGTASLFSLATLSLTVGTLSQGWGRTHTGGLILVSQAQRLAMWDATATAVTAFGILNQLGTHQKIGLRLPRGGGGSTLTFDSVSTGIVAVDCQMILGVFPASLGQDARV